MVHLSLWLLVALARPALPAKLLYLNPFPCYSHVNPFLPLFRELAARGHSVTFVTSLPVSDPPPNFKHVKVNLTMDTLQKTLWTRFGGKPPSPSQIPPSGTVVFLAIICSIMSPLLAEKIKEAMPEPGTKFDLVLLEPFFCMEPIIAASHLYDAPVVVTMPVPINIQASDSTGNPYSFPYVPDTRLGYSNDMSFFQRAWNTFHGVIGLFFIKMIYLPKQDRLMRETFERPDLPYIEDLLQNISLILSMSHLSLDYPRPLLKNVVQIGGVPSQAVKPLPTELKNYLDGAKDGAILFSWGSHYETTDTDKTLENLMLSFSKLKQRVIFKWGNSSIPNKPSNVLVQKWVPQTAILNHKNTVLFINHGGLNSIYEAAFYGVPMVGSPIFGDHFYSMKAVEHHGMGVKVLPTELEEDSAYLSAAINKVLSDPSFKKNAVKRGEMMKDRPMPALDEAVYWVEYILRHGGKHLRPPFLPWYTMMHLDVLLFYLGILLAQGTIFCFCIRIVCCRRSKKPLPDQGSKKEKKND